MKIDSDLANQFLQNPSSVDLSQGTSISDEAADLLSRHEDDLNLFGLNELSAAAAEILSKHKGVLRLGGLNELSDAAAESLSKLEGSLSLSGLTELSDAVAEAFSKCKAHLSLNGVCSISETSARHLENQRGLSPRHGTGILYLEGLKEASDAALDCLARRGRVYFGALIDTPSRIDVRIAKRFVRWNTLVHLHYASEIDYDAAKILSKYEGELSLDGLTELSDAAAEALSKHEGATSSGRLTLKGLKSVGSEVAYFLGKHKGEVELLGIESLPDDVVAALVDGIRESGRDGASRPGSRIVLKTYKDFEISDEAALILTDVMTFVLLNDANKAKVEKAMKAYAQSSATLKPSETKEIRETLQYSDSVEEISAAFQQLRQLDAQEADWLKIFFSKNTLRSLMQRNLKDPEIFQAPFSIDAGDAAFRECVPIWQLLSEVGCQYPKVRELLKSEALKFCTRNMDYSFNIEAHLTEELMPIVNYAWGILRYDAEYNGPLTPKNAVLLATFPGEISIDGIKELEPEVAISFSDHKGELRFNGLECLCEESVEALGKRRGLSLSFEENYYGVGKLEISDSLAVALAKIPYDVSLTIKSISAAGARTLLSSFPNIFSVQLAEILEGKEEPYEW